MDLEDATDTNDSQTNLAAEFNSQTTLSQELNIVTDEPDLERKEKNCSPLVLNGGLGFPILLPPPPSIPLYSETEPDSTFADDLEALFSSPENHAGHLGDLIDVAAEAGVCGLRNLGNTCFMSTGVQCLMATPSLVHCLLSESATKDSLTSHLSDLTHKIWSGHYSAVQPTDFKETLGAHYPQFKDFRQHDCQEFLALLLDGLHEQMNSSCAHNKLQDMLETNCDQDSHSKEVPNLSKSITASHNNFKDLNDSKPFTCDKNEMLSCCKVDKKINNCVVNDITSDYDKVNTSKLPVFEMNNCEEESGNSVVKTDQTSTINNRKDFVTQNVLNNYAQRLNGLEDIIKDAKTSNVNVLVTKQETNNEIKFDSDKFPKSENIRRRECLNFNSFHLYENNVTSGKRGKSTVTHYQNTVDFREGLDLKRLKMQQNEQTENEARAETLMDCDWEKNHRLEDERKHRISSKHLDKNYRMECERRRREGPGPSSASRTVDVSQTDTDLEADLQWQKHLALHQSVIVDTFQGQFKSTVVCSKCKHISVTYEPFMYLSVPLPHAMERQLCVTFLGAEEKEVVQYSLTVNKRDSVGNMRQQLLHMIGRPVSHLVLAEVLDCHIAKILDESHLVRFINSSNRRIYAFELANFSFFNGVESTMEDDKMLGCEEEGTLPSEACIICLEEKESNMNRHVSCCCIICDACVIRTTQHYREETLKCPACRQVLTFGEDLVKVGVTPDSKPPVRMLNVALVFRLDTLGDGNNNTRTVQLFSHPRLLRLPNHLQSQQLHEAVASLTPYSEPYKILFVDGQGHHCSRCMFHAHCRGCPVPTEGSLTLRTGDCLAVMFVQPVSEISTVQHASMLHSMTNITLSLYDCIEAFSQSEILDEHNPWFCPSCKKNQCATKTLSVWRYPDCLIIYLKRFVFQDGVSTKLDEKVTFPLRGLVLPPNTDLYNLYACVCHVGGVSAGHYTAYTQHPRTGEWHYYNDDFVIKQQPQDDDYSNAYILFYKRQGADLKNEDFKAKLFSLSCETPS